MNSALNQLIGSFRLSFCRHGSHFTRRRLVRPNRIEARYLIDRLSLEDKRWLLKRLQTQNGVVAVSPVAEKMHIEDGTDSKQQVSANGDTSYATDQLTREQLFRVAIYFGLPFVGFGVLDNVIMITAGGYIELKFGAMLGISTLAAAALGNMVSDVAGITTAGFVENTFSRLGLARPNLSQQQSDDRWTHIAANLGRCFFVVIGCFIGMTPLLFLPKDLESTCDRDHVTDDMTVNTSAAEQQKRLSIDQGPLPKINVSNASNSSSTSGSS